MGQSIFADESGAESARERDADGRQSIFRRREQDATDETGATDATDGDSGASTRDEASPGEDEAAALLGEDAIALARGDGESDDGTMTVFSGDEVFEIEVDDE